MYRYNDKYYAVEEKKQEVFINFLFFSPRNKVEIKICNELSLTEKILESRFFFPKLNSPKFFIKLVLLFSQKLKKVLFVYFQSKRLFKNLKIEHPTIIIIVILF